MNISAFSIRRPVAVLMAVLAILVLGLGAFAQLKVDLFPDITFPIIAIVTRYPGAAPEEVENFVTRPLEEAAGIVRNLRSIRSISSDGQSVVIAEFEWGTDMDLAAVDAGEGRPGQGVSPRRRRGSGDDQGRPVDVLPDGDHRPQRPPESSGAAASSR